MTNTANPAAFSSRGRGIVYWIATLYVSLEFAVAGTLDILRLPPLFGILIHPGYPGYFGRILGVWKVLGAVALVVPRYPRLKEWAYAGLNFNYTGAAASHLAAGDSIGALVAPTIFIGLVATSWATRPPARRLKNEQLPYEYL